MQCEANQADDIVHPTHRPTILVLASTYPRRAGDPEPGFVHELCRRLAAEFRVIAVVPDAPGADPNGLWQGVEIFRYRYAPQRWQTLVNDGGILANLRRSPWKWLLLPSFVVCQFFAARRILHSQKVDLIHAHWLLPQGLIARYLAARAKLPYLVTSHGVDLYALRGRLATKLKRSVAKSSTAMTVVSTAMCEEAARLALRPPRLDVNPMGVDLSGRFVPDEAQERSHTQLLFVGRLVEKKGLRYLLDAMPKILAHHPDVELLIAGFGPEESALREQVRALHISDHVSFLGPVPQANLPALYRKAALFVAPFIETSSGDQEGLGLVVIEAIGCNCTVVVSALPAVRDVLGRSASDLLVEPRDSDALARTVVSLLDHPSAAHEQIIALRQTVAARFDWSAVAERYSQLIQECISGSRAVQARLMTERLP